MPAAAQEHMEDYVFPPEVVMQYRKQIGLDDKQRDVITQTIREFQREHLELEWDLQDQTQQLHQIMGATRVDETAALEQVERLMTAEGRMKRAHFRMLIRIKNSLTEEQQAKLREIVAERHKHEPVRHQQDPHARELHKPELHIQALHQELKHAERNMR
jgi:Spy/CpxP family protein refolding chaperone